MRIHFPVKFSRIRIALRVVASVVTLLLLLLLFSSAQAQTPAEELLKRAKGAIERVLTPCSQTKFLECVTMFDENGRISGFMNRTVNEGTESTDIKLRAVLNAAEAQNVFKIESESLRQPATSGQFWRTETIAAAPGDDESGTLAVWQPPVTDKPNAVGFGILVCGRVIVNFNLSLTTPPGVFETDGKQLTDLTQAQLRGLMSQLGVALSQDGACESPPIKPSKLDPTASAAPYTIYEGESVNVTGVVWETNDAGMAVSPVKTKVELSGGGNNVNINTTTDAQGYFEVDYPFLDATIPDIYVRAITPDKTRYADGTRTIQLEVKKRGALEISAATDKPIYKPGETVTVSGVVTTDGKPFPADLAVLSDALPLPGVSINADGTFSISFVPGTEPDRNKIGPILPGVHFVVSRATYPAYERAFANVHYLLEGSIQGVDYCEPLAVRVGLVTGVANVLPLDEQELNRLGLLQGMATINGKTNLSEGMTVKTSESARVALWFVFGDGSDAVVVVNGGTTLRIGRFCKDAKGQVHADLAVDNLGQVAVNMTNANPDKGPLDFNIVTPTVKVKSVNTRYFVSVDEQRATTVAALEGTVLVSAVSGGDAVELPAPNVMHVNEVQVPAPALVAPLEGQLDPAIVALFDTTNLAPPVIPPAQPNVSVSTPPAGSTPAASGAPASNSASAAAASTDMGGLVLPGLLGAAALGLLAFGVVLFARHRRAPSGTAQPPVPASPVQPTAPAALPATLPEQKAASPASTTKAAFKRTEDEYFKLKGQLATGRITREQFEARLRELMVQDQQGRYWLLGADTGKWFVHEADGWVEREPE